MSRSIHPRCRVFSLPAASSSLYAAASGSLLLALALAAAGGCERANQNADLSAVEETPGEAADAVSEAPPEPQRAEAGVGRRGQSLEDETGVGAAIAQPAKTLFDVEQRAVFDIKIPHAMQLYRATHGRKPQSHEAFMQEIIQANRIQLPELPEGQEYRYDPEKGELWVYPVEESTSGEESTDP